MAPRTYIFVQWDVFTSCPLAGNPLAIFPDADGLPEHDLQRLARETNHSETVFLFRRPRPVEQECGISMRIFSPERELPFAGHPVLGTALMLSSNAGISAPVSFDLSAGRIEVRFESRDGGKVFGEMLQPEPRFLGSCHRGETAAGLGLSPEDIEPDFPVQIVSTGLPYLIVPLRSLQRIRTFRPDWSLCAPFLAGLTKSLGLTVGLSLYVVARETNDPRSRVHCRCLDEEREDPATGSAAGCAAAWMVQHGIALPDEQVMIEQGLEIQRPSQLFVRAALDRGKPTGVRVGGFGVEVLRGIYILD